MSRTIILLFLAMCALVPAIGKTQTTIEMASSQPQKLKLNFIRAEWDSLDVILLYSNDGRSHEMICGFNPWYGESRSRLEYKNQYRLRVAQFSMDDYSCLRIFNFMKAAFEGIDQQHQVSFEIDLTSGVISKVSLPALDFYEDQTQEQKTDHPTLLP